MSATDELRRLLDERGVKWRRAPHYSSKSVDDETIFAGNGVEWYAREYRDNYVELRTLRLLVTPSQAVDATVGRETCRDVGFAPYFFECSECGKTHLRNAAYVDMPNYCPSCGRKVVES